MIKYLSKLIKTKWGNYVLAATVLGAAAFVLDLYGVNRPYIFSLVLLALLVNYILNKNET